MLRCSHARRPDIAKSAGRTFRKTWRTVIEKVTQPSGAQNYQWLHDIADAAVSEQVKAFLDAVKQLRTSVIDKDLGDAIESRDIGRIVNLLGTEQAVHASLDTLQAPMFDVVSEAGTAAIDATPALADKGGALAMRFDMLNPNTVQAMRSYGFNLVRQISNDTRNGLRQIGLQAMQYGGHPYEQARQMKQLIGLTETQAAAVGNFRNLLETGSRDALDRALRDRRFDSTLDRALGADAVVDLTPEKIDRMVGRYADRMLTMRAETIARTETISAARLGTQMAWEQAAEHGLLNRTTLRQGWLTTPDDRLCPDCSEVPDLNEDGVPLGGKFETPLGPVDGPTLHPNCRCVLYLMEL